MVYKCDRIPLTYPLPRSSFANGYSKINCRAKSSHRALPGLGPYLAVGRVTRVRTMSPHTASLRIPSSKASCVSSLQNSGSCILFIDLDGVVETLASDPGEIGDEGPREREGSLTAGDVDSDTPARPGSRSSTVCCTMKNAPIALKFIQLFLTYIYTVEVGINLMIFLAKPIGGTISLTSAGKRPTNSSPSI